MSSSGYLSAEKMMMYIPVTFLRLRYAGPLRGDLAGARAVHAALEVVGLALAVRWTTNKQFKFTLISTHLTLNKMFFYLSIQR